MWLLYQIVATILLTVAGPFLLARRGSHYLPTLPGRLGGYRGRTEKGALWIHAVSVGEVGVAATLVAALPEDLPLLVTTVTPTGQDRARALLAERAMVAYLPFDLGIPLERFLRRFEPRALILVEGDYWPLLLHKLTRRGTPVTVVNGRVSEASHRRMGRLPRLACRLLASVDRFGMQTLEDRHRLVSLGVQQEKIEVTGNLKFESPEPAALPDLEASLLELAGGRPILMAGSTMAGEEVMILKAFQSLPIESLLILAPRHPERWNEVEQLLRQEGVRVVRRTRLQEATDPQVVLLDSLGELAALYRLAAAAFIGGTLVPTGGHNPLEAARFGIPVAVGPSMDNFRQMAEIFDRERAWARVNSAQELATVWQGWLEDRPLNEHRERVEDTVGQRARALVEANRGALEKTLDLLRPVVMKLGERS